MKYLNFFIIISMMLSACVFSEKPKKQPLIESSKEEIRNHRILGDSIMVDTVIGDFRLFYKISEIKDQKSSQPDGEKISDKEIYLNIQKLDTTSVLSGKVLTIYDFKQNLDELKDEDYCIDIFYLKEVRRDSVIFGTELYSIDKARRIEVDLLIDEEGIINYLQK